MNRNIILTETQFKEIYQGYLKYLALERGGVDNWEWYSESLNDFLKTCYFEDHPNKTIGDYYNDGWFYDFDVVVDDDLDKCKFTIQEVDE